MSVTKPKAGDQKNAADFTSYVTFRLDLLKTEMNRRANLLYRREFDLNVRSLRVLRAICDVPGRTSSEVRELTLIEKTLLSKVVADLIERKLVRRTIHPEDARHYQLWPTPDGKRTRAASDKIGHSLEQQMLLSVLSAAELDELHRILGKLANGLRASARNEKNDASKPE
jgi:DNA-binding MarR family transcriptional regulator